MNARLVARSAPGFLVIGLLGVALPTRAPGETPIFEPPLSPRIANYDVRVTLDDREKRLFGDLVLTWNNPSNDRIDELQFHLYTNAFKNARSTFNRELIHTKATGASRGEHVKTPWEKDGGWGWLRVTKMAVDGADVTDRIAFHQPDDGNVDDETVIRVPLNTPVEPGATARIEMVFESKIPHCHRRTGWWQDDFFMLAHWLPKIGVYETPGMRFVPPDAPRGRWNCHQFHAATEFYADYGVYDVQITLPDKYVVGTTGLIVEERVNGDGTKTVVAHAEDVHEFAWVADAQFREAVRVWRTPSSGREVSIRLLYQPDHAAVATKYLRSVSSALSHVERWLGEGAYPYPNITVVDPRKGSHAGGMEYPTLITGGARWWREELFGDGLRFVESVTIHEFMHQIWYGIVGSNEFEEAWLDEGFTSYSDMRIAGDLFGEKTTTLDWWGATAGDVALRRLAYAGAASKQDASIAEFTFLPWHLGVGRNMAYNKTSLMLVTLENYLGRERFDHVTRSYFQRHRFGHPSRDDFIAVANETAGEDLSWFFDQLIHDDTVLDYAVASIANVPLDSFDEGLADYDVVPPDIAEDQDESQETQNKVYQSTVVFRRIGEVVFPMETLIEFDNGSVVRETWDGRDRTKTYRFTRPAKVVRAAIDPDFHVPLDVNRLNNSRRIEPNEHVMNKYTLKGFFWMQSLLQLVSLLG